MEPVTVLQCGGTVTQLLGQRALLRVRAAAWQVSLTTTAGFLFLCLVTATPASESAAPGPGNVYRVPAGCQALW